MFKDYKDSIKLWHFENISNCSGILHFVSTRLGGCSSSPYDSLNLGLDSGDNPLKVIKNRELLASTLGISIDNFVSSWQVHGDKVRIMTRESLAAEGSHSRMPKVSADAMVTTIPGACLMVYVADCTPLFFCDSGKKVVGIAHAGWKGTIKGVARNVVRTMTEELGCSVSDIQVGIGPSIGPCCYQVGPEVIEEVAKAFGETEALVTGETSAGRGYFDLWEANRRQLVESGIAETNIESSNQCTRCHPETFFSYRYHGPKSGRFAAGIMIW